MENLTVLMVLMNIQITAVSEVLLIIYLLFQSLVSALKSTSCVPTVVVFKILSNVTVSMIVVMDLMKLTVLQLLLVQMVPLLVPMDIALPKQRSVMDIMTVTMKLFLMRMTRPVLGCPLIVAESESSVQQQTFVSNQLTCVMVMMIVEIKPMKTNFSV